MPQAAIPALDASTGPTPSLPAATLLGVSVSHRTLFAAVGLFALILRLACMTGLAGSDDLGYALYARAMAAGNYNATLDADPRRHHGLRYSVIAPVAVVYKVFGISEWSTVVLPLLASTLSVVLLAEIGRLLFGIRVAMIAALLYATFPLQLVIGGALLPEPIAGFYALLGVLCYVHARRRGGWLWIAAGVLMGTAYLAKESALFIGGAFLVHALWERQWRGALLFAAGVAAVGAAEHTYYLLWKGDLLFRPHSTKLYKFQSTGFFDVQERDLAYRLFRKYPQMMLVPNLKMGLHSLVCVAGAVAALRLRPRAGYTMVLLWAVIPWLYLNFGTWSLAVYAPLPADERYIEYTYPPLMLLTAIVITRALSASAIAARSAATLLAVVMAAGVWAGFATRGTIGKAPEMTVLRAMVAATQQVPGQTIYTVEPRWRRALEIFDASLLSNTREGATIILTTDPLGFPSVQSRGSAAEGVAQ